MLRLVRSLEVRDMSFKYPLAPAWTLDSVSLVINRGESVAFTGASGAGKSTLIDILLGLIAPQHGEVTVDGTNILMNLDGWRQTIGYVPQTIYLLDDSVRANIAFGISPENINEARIWRALEMAQLADMVRQLPQGLNTTVGERGARISGGERQRIGIARALYHDPEVLIFDEATSALDHRTEREIAETINALRVNKTLIIVAHRMTSVVHCDRIYFVKNGQIADKGTYNELVANNSDFRKMTGEPDD